MTDSTQTLLMILIWKSNLTNYERNTKHGIFFGKNGRFLLFKVSCSSWLFSKFEETLKKWPAVVSTFSKVNYLQPVTLPKNIPHHRSFLGVFQNVCGTQKNNCFCTVLVTKNLNLYKSKSMFISLYYTLNPKKAECKILFGGRR